jgi:hypothetical protein
MQGEPSRDSRETEPRSLGEMIELQHWAPPTLLHLALSRQDRQLKESKERIKTDLREDGF